MDDLERRGMNYLGYSYNIYADVSLRQINKLHFFTNYIAFVFSLVSTPTAYTVKDFKSNCQALISSPQSPN